MAKKIFFIMILALSLWNITYIALLTDSFIQEYCLDKFFYWGYPQWGWLYSSPKVFLWFNIIYISVLIFAVVYTYICRYKVVRSFLVAFIVAIISLLNMYVPEYNWNKQYDIFQAEKGNAGSRVPAGTWLAGVETMQAFDEQSVWMKMKGLFGRGNWPGGYYLWGDYRIWLVAGDKTDDLGRRGMVIHGGIKNSSPWGIDMGNAIVDFAAQLREAKVPLELNLSYSE